MPFTECEQRDATQEIAAAVQVKVYGAETQTRVWAGKMERSGWIKGVFLE